MSLIIATGSNIGNPLLSLEQAKSCLQKNFELIAESRIYVSAAVGVTDQPDFYNQVLEFTLPACSPEEAMTLILRVEQSLGRVRDVRWGPRTIDIDIIFWGNLSITSELLTVPHPRWSERSFVVRPLQELPFFKTVRKCFTIPKSFQVEATPLT